ncbi:MAG TPA: glycosyltransferase family 2 protein, partial [Solirubrobacteraceae bacterium]|nr:glycosyltransferase family 2 protein [Solirubrobacteraceae bacterium]
MPDLAPVDPDTGLATAARLLADLNQLRTNGTSGDTRLLAAFELAGLDAHERKCGAAATNELLGRLATRLADVVWGAGAAYRIGRGRFAIVARVGRGGSQTIVRSCTVALCDDRAGIRARPLTTVTPIDLINPADALLLIGQVAGNGSSGIAGAGDTTTTALLDYPSNDGGHYTCGRMGNTPSANREDSRGPTIAEARRSVGPRRNPPPGRLPYLQVSTRFKLSVLFGIVWMGVSAWLAWPWIAQLADSISLPAALALVAGIALIPGYLNVQLVSSLLMDRPAPIDIRADVAFPALTLLVAAYDEQRDIGQTLAYALEQDYPGDLNMILVDDGSRDETANVARSFTRLDERLRLLQVPHGGKARALNAGLRAVRTPLVATIDADTLLMPGALRRIVTRMLLSPPDTVAVAGSVMVRNSRRGLLSAVQTWDYFLGIGSIKRQQALLQATLVAQGAFSVYDTEALRVVGGWPDCIGEDIVMTWALLDRGGRTTFEPSAIAFTTVPETFRHLARQRRRWARGMIEGLRMYGGALVRRRKAFAHSVIADALFPYLDATFTFAFIPGIALAITGNFAIVGPMTLAVLPLNGLLAGIMYRRQRRSLREAGLHVRR